MNDIQEAEVRTQDALAGIEERAFGGPTASSWREQALTRIAELEDLTAAFRTCYEKRCPDGDLLAEGIYRHLATARAAAGSKPGLRWWKRPWSLVGGSPLERTASNIDAAETDLLRLAPPPYLHGQLPSLVANMRQHLSREDPRRQAVELICRQPAERLTASGKDAIIAATRAARSAARREIVRVRSFRNILYVCSFALAVVVVGLVLIARANPQLLPLCFHPGDVVVCPTSVDGPVPQDAPNVTVDEAIRDAAGPWDIPLVSILGLVAAALAGAVSLRNLQGTTLPYSLPVALAVLKLPSGALTAILGLLLMSGEFVPGLSALDTPAQILAWAILFGYAQQLFTRLVDKQAHTILNEVSGQEAPRGAVPQATEVGLVTKAKPVPDEPSNGADGTAPQPAPVP